MTNNHDVKFYTLCSDNFFLGLVGLINSLRLTGHHNELVVLDCGLTQSQRDILRPHCSVVALPDDLAGSHPYVLKPFPHVMNAQGLVVLIDSDIIVTRSLEPIFSLAREGKICAFPANALTRWIPAWKQLFNLEGEMRKQMCVNSGFVAFSTSSWPRLLERWWQACQRMPAHWQQVGHKRIIEGDQDALNAILMSEIPSEALEMLPEEEGPTKVGLRKGVQVLDVSSLRCAYRGHTTRLLHSTGSPKPWQTGAWKAAQRNAYVRLLSRLLLGTDVAITIPSSELPIWLRAGTFASLSLAGLDIVTRLGYLVRYSHQFLLLRKQILNIVRKD
jgi:hypothetical protein